MNDIYLVFLFDATNYLCAIIFRRMNHFTLLLLIALKICINGKEICMIKIIFPNHPKNNHANFFRFILLIILISLQLC